MPRARRALSESGFYHVTMRGNGRQIIFEDDEDRKSFLDFLRRGKEKYQVGIIAWCLMDNHVHLLVGDQKGTISKIMQSLASGYAGYFNRKYGQIGHVFQDRFASSPIESDVYLLETVQYIHNNPAKAGICLAEEYPWSSFSEYVLGSGLSDTEMVLSMVGGVDGFILFSKNHVPSAEFGPGKVRKPSDKDAAEIAAEALRELGLEEHASSLKAMKGERRDVALLRLREKGLSVRQIQSLTGLGRTTISKATSARCQG